MGRVESQGGTLIFSHIHRLGLFFGFKILNFNIFGGFQKMIFLGYEDFVINFWGHYQIGLVRGSFLCILGSFFKVKVQIWDIFWVAKISNIFLGCLKFLIFFWGEL